MSNEEYSRIAKFMATYDRRYIYLVTFALTALLILYPIGMPIEVSPITREYYDFVNSLGPDDIALFDLECYFSEYLETIAGSQAALKLLVENEAKIAIAASRPEGPAIITAYLIPLLDRLGYVEGEDYVVIGFVFPNEPAHAAIADDFHGNIKQDWKGQPITGTFLDNVQTGEDIALVLTYTGGSSEFFTRHFTEKYGTRLAINCIGVCIPMVKPYSDAYEEITMLESTRGGAELEYLIGSPGPGLTAMDAFTANHYALIIFIIIGNIGYFSYTRPRREKERTTIG
jgi:hypothetical protein